MNSNRPGNYFLDRNLWLTASESDFLKQCEIENYQDSGKGGQKRNRKYSAVRLTHIPTGVSVTSSERREQNVNKLKALEKLKIKIATMFSGPEVDIPRNIISIQSLEYPLWSAFLLDELYKNDFEITPIAKKLRLSNSKLLKLIYRDRVIWDELNSNRAKSGKHSFILHS